MCYNWCKSWRFLLYLLIWNTGTFRNICSWRLMNLEWNFIFQVELPFPTRNCCCIGEFKMIVIILWWYSVLVFLESHLCLRWRNYVFGFEKLVLVLQKKKMGKKVVYEQLHLVCQVWKHHLENVKFISVFH